MKNLTFFELHKKFYLLPVTEKVYQITWNLLSVFYWEFITVTLLISLHVIDQPWAKLELRSREWKGKL